VMERGIAAILVYIDERGQREELVGERQECGEIPRRTKI